MGTRWRGLLAPIDESTGDGRRLKQGGGGWRELPFALKWQRTDAMGHDDSVVVGSTDTMNIGTVQQAIANNWISEDAVAQTMQPTTLGAWGAGEMFDDDDIAKTLPRLSEDVGEAKLMLGKKVIGPSIDPDNVTQAVVRKGSDKPLTWDEIDMILWECEENAVDPSSVLETLYMTWRVTASTLVVTPAFAECRPFELGPFANAATTAAPADAALVASLTAAAGLLERTVVPASLFAVTPSDEVHAIRVEDGPGGVRRIYGYAAQNGSCHVGFRNVCVTPPESQTGYSLFHRYPQDTDQGLIDVGRITTGLGQIGTGCADAECRGKDDHACSNFSLARTLQHYDGLRTVAHVRATDTPLGIWVCGVVEPTATAADLAVLARRMVSGDWRESGTGLELVEVLALFKEQPGFPVPTAATRGGRAYSLVAAGGVMPEPRHPRTPCLTASAPAALDEARLAERAADLVMDRLTTAGLVAPAAVTAAAEHTGAMIALVPSVADAARLATDDYEPVEELHTTLLFLGEASDIPPDRQEAIVAAVRDAVAGLGPIVGRAFAVSLFNPDAAAATVDDMPAIVLGMSGAGLVDVHTLVSAAVAQQFAYPEQYVPWQPHMTLAYSTDFGLVGQLAEGRTGEVVYDRIRIAYGGVVTDIALTGNAVTAAEGDDEPGLLAEVDEALGALEAGDLRREADLVAAEIEAVSI